MPAAVYTTDLTDISTAESATGFSEPTGSTAGGVPTVENDYFIQGSFCVSKTFNATGVGGIGFTAGAGVTIPTDGAVYAWTYFAAPNALNTKVNGGMQVIIGSSLSAYNRYYVSGRDTYEYGGWVCWPVNPSVTASAANGSPTSTRIHFGMACNVTNAVSKGNPCAIDVIRYGRGTLRIVGGEWESLIPAQFTAAAAQNDAQANRWGILSLVDGIFKYQGHLLLGDTSTSVQFVDSNKNIVIQNTEFVTSNFNLIEIRHASSYVRMTNISILSLSTVSRGNFLVTDDADIVLDSCTFTDMGTFTFKPNTTVVDTTFRRCNTITHGGANITQCLIARSNATSALITANPSTITETQFISAGTGHAIEITTPGTYTLDNNVFEGYGATGTTNAAIYNNSGGAVTINVIGDAGLPTYRNGTGATTAIVSSAIVELTGLKADSEVRAYLGTDPDTATEIGGIENSSTSFSFSQSYAGQSGYIQIFHLGYQPVLLPIVYSGSNVSIPIQQIVDRQYFTVFVNPITLSNVSITTGSDSPADATATFSLLANGNQTKTNSSGGTEVTNTWITPANGMSGYECSVTVNSGSVTGSPVNTWLNLGTNRSWSVVRDGALSNGSTTAQITVSIRQVGTVNVLGTATINLSAQVDGPYATATQVGLLGAASLAQLISANADDANTAIVLPFPFYFNGVDYGQGANGGIHVCSNSFITFGYTSTAYNNFTATTPGRGIFLGTADNSWQRVYAGSEGIDKFRVRYEGTAATSGTVGSPNIVWEITFYDNYKMQVVYGTHNRLAGVQAISNGTAYTTMPFTTANTSYYIDCSKIGDTWVGGTGSIATTPTI